MDSRRNPRHMDTTTHRLPRHSQRTSRVQRRTNQTCRQRNNNTNHHGTIDEAPWQSNQSDRSVLITHATETTGNATTAAKPISQTRIQNWVKPGAGKLRRQFRITLPSRSRRRKFTILEIIYLGCRKSVLSACRRSTLKSPHADTPRECKEPPHQCVY